MTSEVGAMTVAGVAMLAAGLALAHARVAAATGVGKLLALGPVFAAAPLAVFSMEHFTIPHDMAGMVPRWLPAHLFWIYFVGVALLLGGISFIVWRCVRISAPLLALLFLIIVATIDLPNLHAGLHDRFFWILTVREISFAGGAMALGFSLCPRATVLARVGRTIVALVMIFYAVEHFLHPHNVVGVPLEKLTPAWMPAPVLIAYVVGLALLAGGIGLLIPSTARIAAAGAGTVLLVVTFVFYGAILIPEFRTPLAVEGLNYVYDTMLFAATVLLAGWESGFSGQLSGVRDQLSVP